MDSSDIGISGFGCYLPPYRVRLEDWCGWTGDDWDKVRAVVGDSYRMPGPDENAYTMAATALLRLIRQYDVDPQRIGFLALGTESSTDNSAGAVIVKGMLDQGLAASGLPPLRRACEVPEFKHACLGGVYALKAAVRYLALDGADRVGVVVCSDIAEYRRASSGEATQGAGAVALLVEPRARLLAVDLTRSGASSAYRGVDFRKPFARFFGQAPGVLSQPRDYPVFNGKYSTTCYLDAVLAAARDQFQRLDGSPAAYLRSLAGVFLHRPYQRMAETGLAFCYLLALALGDDDDQGALAELCAEAGLEVDALRAELLAEPEVQGLVGDGDLAAELYPVAAAAARRLRGTAGFAALTTSLGVAAMKHTGNLYTASLPAWVAAGLEEAAGRGDALAGRELLTVGYGSGDAADLVPMRVTPGWEAAAGRIGFAAALDGAVDLDAEAYQALHDGAALPAPRRRAAASGPGGVFRIDHIGNREGRFDDFGIEYYRYEP